MGVIPNTNVPGQILISTGRQNDSKWGGAGGVPGSLGNVSVLWGVAMYGSAYYYLNWSTYFPASQGEGGTLTSYPWLPTSAGFGRNVCVMAQATWANIDTSAAARTINVVFTVAEVAGTNFYQSTIAATIPQVGPGQSYNFTTSDWGGGTLVTNGSDLSQHSGPDRISSAAGLVYASSITWNSA